MNKNYTHSVVILDRSGSMFTCAVDMEGGLNQYVEDQKKESGKMTLSFYRFDDVIDRVLDFVDIQSVEKLRLEPRGSTSLNDALGKAITETGYTLSRMKEQDRPALVSVIIVTDGGENSSKEFSTETIKNLIKEQESKYNWQFTYLGANQDSFSVAQAYAINTSNVSNFNINKSKNVWGDYSKKMSNSRGFCASGAAPSFQYTEEEREDLV